MRCAAKRALRNQSWGLICSRLRALQCALILILSVIEVGFNDKRITMRFHTFSWCCHDSAKCALYCAGAFMSPQEVGQKFRDRRKALKLRQRDLAELAGITLRGLTNLENGQANPTLKQLAKIADVLGLEVSIIERSCHGSS